MTKYSNLFEYGNVGEVEVSLKASIRSEWQFLGDKGIGEMLHAMLLCFLVLSIICVSGRHFFLLSTVANG